MHSSIGEIYDGAGNMQISCNPSYTCPEPNPLNPSADKNFDGL